MAESVVGRLESWIDGVQLSNRLGAPIYRNPSELKRDVQAVLAALEAAKEIVDAADASNGLDPSYEDLAELREALGRVYAEEPESAIGEHLAEARAVEAGRVMGHSLVESESWYAKLDPGIRFAVRVLHARGIHTQQSCQGGKGHSYDRPTVDLSDMPAAGFEALAALVAFGLPVWDVSRVWPVENGYPFECFWRVTFRHPMEDRADELPNFQWSYVATPVPGEAVEEHQERKHAERDAGAAD